MNQSITIKVLIIHFKEYESFYTIQTLSKFYGKYQFLIKKQNHSHYHEIIVGLLYLLTIREENDKIEVLEYLPMYHTEFENIEPIRLFAVQSLCALINTTVYNIDDINKMISFIPKIQLIFLHDNWFKLYLFLEFKLLLMYDRHNKLARYDICQRIRNQRNYGGKLINRRVAQLDLINNMWYQISDKFVVPKEQIILYKLLILENKM